MWIEASYKPHSGPRGQPFKGVKLATDITAQRMTEADLRCQMVALRSSQAVIDIALDGTILCVKQMLLDAMGDTLEEV